MKGADFFMNRIRDLREDADLKQSDLAKAVGIAQRTLSNYETGKTNPDSYAIIKLAEYFNVSADYLLGIENAGSKRRRAVNIKRMEKKISEMQAALNEISDILKKMK